MKREDIIRDIHGLDVELAALEEHYGLLSAEFYHCYRAGELEQSPDFIRWAGYFEAKQDRETPRLSPTISTSSRTCATTG